MLERLLAAAAGRFSLVAFGDPACPVSCIAAIPDEGTQPGSGWLPPAARPASRRAALGRGFTPERAVIGCLGEAAELVSSCHWGDEPVVRATRDQLGPRAVAPNDLLLVSEKQFARQPLDRASLPAPFAPGEPMDWVEAGQVEGGPARLIPAAFAYIGYPGAEERWRSYAGNSSGCAAGETLDQAMVAGFLELVERDAAAIWWYGRHPRPAVDLAGLPRAVEIVRWLGDSARGCHVLDISSDMGIPVIAAVSAPADGSDLAFGFAARFDASEAVEAALGELAQQVLAGEVRAGAADRPRRPPAAAGSLPHLDPAGTTDIGHLPSASPATTGLAFCLELCARRGLELLALDLTRPALAVPVARVVVPGLRHTLPNFAPGRLYEVPECLGWERRREDELNLLPLPG